MDNLKKFVLAIFFPQCLKGLSIYICHTAAFQWHKKLALNNHPKLSRLQRILIRILSILSWYFAIFWIQLLIVLFRILKLKRMALKTFPDLLYLGLWIGADPNNYFTLNLNEVKKTNWINYIFIEEQLTWFISPEVNENHTSDIKILNDKYLFSQKLHSNSLPSVKTLFHFTSSAKKEKIQSAINELVQSKTDFFIKPQSSNAMRGCLIVKVNKKTIIASGFNLMGKSIKVTHVSDLIGFIQTLLNSNQHQSSGILFQPLLTNSDSMYEVTSSKQASVLRIITFNSFFPQNPSKPKIEIIYALLEKESSTEFSLNKWEIFPIDISNGKFNQNQIPQWKAITETTIKAHKLFPSMSSIAWDVVLSKQGILIIEGNVGWNIIEPQRFCQKAALTIFLKGQTSLD